MPASTIRHFGRLALAWTVAAAVGALLAAPASAGGDPGIGAVTVSAVTPSSATLTWRTERPTDSVVEYGTSASLGLWSLPSPELVREHRVVLYGLAFARGYRLRIDATDVDGATTTSDGFELQTPALGVEEPQLATAGGEVRFDGAPYFPLLQWQQCASDIEANIALGIDVFLGDGCGSGPADLLQRLGGRALAVLPAPQTGPAAAGVGGWYLPDEPDSAGISPGLLRDLAPAEQARAQQRLRFLTISPRFFSPFTLPPLVSSQSSYRDYAAAADVVGFGLYPRAHCDQNWPLLDVYASQRELTALAPGQPTYQWIETGPPRSDQNCGGWTLRPEELRAEVWLAIAGGATGIGYFTHTWTPGHMAFDVQPELQRELLRTNRQITDLAPALLGQPVPLRVISDGSVVGIARRYDGVTYIFAVNAGNAPAAVRFTAPELDGSAVRVFEEERSLPNSAAGFGDQFDPLAVHVYVAAP